MGRTSFTVDELLRRGQGYLLKKGNSFPRLDAEILLAHALPCPRLHLYTLSNRPLERSLLRTYMRLLRRRARGEPTAYLTGRKEFCGLDLEVTPEVLIPRPETEILAEQALRVPGQTALDLGTGSGAIALALSQRFQVTASDHSETALRVAERNAQRHHASIRFVRSDLFEKIPDLFDAIVSNPPYVRTSEWPSLPPEVQCEPRLALDGGPNGLDVIRPLITQAPHHLHPNGCLLIEVGAGQSDTVAQFFHQAGFQDIRIFKDLSGIERVVKGVRQP